MKPVVLLALLLALLVIAWRLMDDAETQSAVSAPDHAPTQQGLADAVLQAVSIQAQDAVRADVSELPADAAADTTDSGPVPPAEPVRHILRALCLDESGSALAGVDVEAVSLRGHPRTVSEADGRVTLVLEDPMPVGWPHPQMVGSARRPVVRFASQGRAAQVVSADLRGARDVDLGVVVLPLGGDIVGRVLGDGGLPLSGVRLGAMIPRPPNLTSTDRDYLRVAGPELALSYRPGAGLTETGFDGRFRLRNLPPGATSVLAAGSGTFSTWTEPVDVRPGETVSVGDVRLETCPPEERIGGRVLDSAGRGATGAWVTSTAIRTHTRSAGRLALCAADGSFSLVARAGHTYEVEAHQGEQTVRVDEVHSGTRDLQLVLGPQSPESTPPDDGTRLRGRVTSDGLPVVGTLVRVDDERGREQARVRTDAEGRFALAPRGGGDWCVSAHSEAGQDYRVGEAGPWRIGAGQEVEDIELVLDLPGALVGQVRVAPGESRAGYRVVAERRGRERSGSTGADGTWSIEDMLPGVWVVSIHAPGNMSDQSRVLKNATAELEVAAGDIRRWDLDLNAAWPCRLTGHLLFGGRAPAGWTSTMSGHPTGLGPGGTFEGRFEEPGPLLWVVRSPIGSHPFVGLWRTLELLRGDNHLELDLPVGELELHGLQGELPEEFDPALDAALPIPMALTWEGPEGLRWVAYLMSAEKGMLHLADVPAGRIRLRHRTEGYQGRIEDAPIALEVQVRSGESTRAEFRTD